MTRRGEILLVLCVCLLSFALADHILGVPKSEQELFSGEFFTCRQSGEKIPFSMVNDDFCDCADGSDEPGTSACSNVILLPNYEIPRTTGFHCVNKGFKSTYIANSFVNDGICDCCDGSDEYNNPNLCVDTCKEKGKEELQQVLKEIHLHEEGWKEKLVLIEEAKNIRPSLQSDFDNAKQQLEELRTNLEALKEEEERTKIISDLADEIHYDDSEDYIREDEEVDDEDATNRYYARNDEEKVSKRAEFQEKYGMTAAEAKEAYKNAKSAVKTCNKDIKDRETQVEHFEKLLGTDFGPQDEFLALRGKSFSVRAGGYNYELRVFESASQGSTSLGNWDGWLEPLKKMSYKGGKRCWGAGDREATVTVDCGITNVVEQVDEPSTCSYTMVLRTPAACSLDYAKSLRSSYGVENEEIVLDIDSQGNAKAGWFGF